MKKRAKSVSLALVSSVLLGIFYLNGCGSQPKAADAITSTAEPQTVIVEKIVEVPTEIYVTETSVVEKIVEVPTEIYITETSIVEKEVIKEVIKTEKVYVTKTEPLTDKKVDTISDYNTSFTSQVDVSGRLPVYLGTTRTFTSSGTEWFSSDTNIAVVAQNGVVTALDEGLCEIVCLDSNGNVKDTFSIYCTTVNDGVDPKSTSLHDEFYIPQYQDSIRRDGWVEKIKLQVKTVEDLMWLCKDRRIKYDSSFPIIATNSKWTWALDGQSVMELEKGVCCDISNFAAYFLQNDYEKLGFIYVCGFGVGHVFNYVYEDGYYYVFDLTRIIANCRDYGNKYVSNTDYPIYKYKSLSEIINEPRLVLGSDETKDNTLMILAIDSMNMSEHPPVHLNYMSYNEKNNDELYIIGVQEGINVEILFQNPIYTNLNFKFFSEEELPLDVPNVFADASFDY